MRIKAAVARGNDRPLTIEALTLDEPRPDEILVRLVASGVSRFDRLAAAGGSAMPLPFVPGGAGAGLVEAVGEAVHTLAAGDAVLLVQGACGLCPACVAGRSLDCEAFADFNLSGRRQDGSRPFVDGGEVGGFFLGQSSFATHVLCRAACAIKLPTDAPLEILAALPGEVMAGANAMFRASRPREARSLLVVGAGPCGLAASMVAKVLGVALIVVVDPDEARRELALTLGATIAIHAEADLAASVRSLAADGVDVVIETTGRDELMRASLDCLSMEGAYVAPHAWGAAKALVEDERIRPAFDRFEAHALALEMLDLHASEALPIERLVTFFPFDLIEDALRALDDPAVVVPVVRFPLGSFGDLDRAKTEGAASEAPAQDGDSSVPEAVQPGPDGNREPEPVAELRARIALEHDPLR